MFDRFGNCNCKQLMLLISCVDAEFIAKTDFCGFMSVFSCFYEFNFILIIDVDKKESLLTQWDHSILHTAN